MNEKKTGLVLEGGAMRGMFTCGVIDVMMEHDITFDGAIGVSAGSVFGCNYKSHQIGRAIRYNKKYCKDKRYASFHSLLTTGNLYGKEFCYHTLPFELDLWDQKSYQENPMKFYVTCTDIENGEAVYHLCETGDEEDIEWMRASASLPLVSQIVEIDGKKLLDGGMADAVPYKKFRSMGYNRTVVVLTQPMEYRKKKNHFLPIIRLVYRKYPQLIASIEDRHIRYNAAIKYICEKEKEGEVFVIRPKEALHIGAMEKNPQELERVYQLGRKAAMERLEDLKAYLNQA